jgi:molybdenum cofactor synthesis domain-containing protein
MSATGRRALVLSISTRGAAGLREDTAGPMLTAGLTDAGFDVDGPQIVPDGSAVGDALRQAIATGFDVVATTGGTGVTPNDVTPEQTRPLLDRELPGIAEAIRAVGVAHGVPTAVLSRGLAGVAGATVIVNLPGSPKAIPDGLEVLVPVLAHLVDQVRGGDHMP